MHEKRDIQIQIVYVETLRDIRDALSLQNHQ